MPLRILAPLALALSLTAGCGTIPLKPPLSLGDPCEPVRKVTVAFGAVGFPTLFVVGPTGRIESMHMGVIDAETLASAVRSARGAG